ncbi:uncharacterized protein LOC143244966 isoform X2 [Tachypleus tridentatus]|uniref:uncharacterized protein LOC143244966 isoform X2 n=1 Tax=Tachypleus tridentatus TaxID=6853 RepID=UPI003FD5DF28
MTLYQRRLEMLRKINRHVEVLNFVVPRVCPVRTPNKEELKTTNELERNALVLQFFLDFYSGFLQVVLQLYILVSYFDGKIDFNTLSKWELVASVLSVKTLLCAVRRKDDGILSTFLSYLGWGSIFISRAVVFALATSVIYYGILGFSLIHALLFSVWISTLVWRSHEIGTSENPTPSQLSYKRKMHYFVLVFFLFGLPSLIYWPYMFQLREGRRFVIYIAVIVLENAGLYAIWFFIPTSFSWSSHQLYSTIIVGGCTVLGVAFLAFYCCWKPSLTDTVVLFNKRADNMTDFGIYFDFFDAVFKLKVDKRDEALLTEIRNNRSEDDCATAI